MRRKLGDSFTDVGNGTRTKNLFQSFYLQLKLSSLRFSQVITVKSRCSTSLGQCSTTLGITSGSRYIGSILLKFQRILRISIRLKCISGATITAISIQKNIVKRFDMVQDLKYH